MYCSVEDVRKLLPQYVNIGDQNIGTPSPGRPDVKRSNLTPDDTIKFIRLGQQEVDGRLRQFYQCPLRRVKTYETEILQDVNHGSNVKIWVWDTGPFSKFDTLRLQNSDNMELVTVSDIQSEKILVVSSVTGDYTADNSEVSIVEFPDPVPLITARLATAFAFDVLFSAQQSPDISEYGKEQKKLALNALDSILIGTVLLFGQEHTGRRFVRGSLFDAYDAPTNPQAADFQFGREKA